MLCAAFFTIHCSLFTSCSSGDQDFPDFDYQTVYFAKQYPVRTVELGNDDYVDVTLDNQHKVNIKATMGGAYTNRRDITVEIAVDPTLIDGLKFKDSNESLVLLPSSHYNLTDHQIHIPAGEISAGVIVELTDKFFDDPKSLTTHYVLPIRMVGKAEGVDSILEDKDFVLYAVKYINRYQAKYVHAKNTNTVVSVTSAGLNTCHLQYAAKDAEGKNHNCQLVLNFANDGTCNITTDTEGFTVQGSGRFVEADESQLLGARHPDTMYLKFSISNPTLGITASEDYTLLCQTRGVAPENFEVIK